MSKVPYKVLSTGALAAALSVSAVSVPAFANAADVSYGDVHFDELEAISNSELANIKSIGSSHSDYSTYFNDEGNFKKLPTSVEVNNKNVDYNALADKMSASGAKNINEFIEQGNELPTSELQVESVSAINATTMEVSVTGNPYNLTPEDFQFDNGLEVTDIEVVEADAQVAAADAEKTYKVILTTTKQESGVSYSLTKVGGEELETTVEVVVEEVELAIEEVAATTDTIKQEEDQEVEFTIDGEYYTVSQLEKSGYEVDFLYNYADTDTDNVGVIDASNLDTFKYAVEISKGDQSVTSDWAEVTAYSATDAVEVTSAGLNDDWELDYITQNENGQLSFEAKSAVNHFGDELKDDNLPDVTKVEANDPTIAYYNNGSIEVRDGKTGEAQFDVYFEGIEEPVTKTVEIKENIEISSLDQNGDSLKVLSGKTDQEVELTLNDQYGEDYRNSVDGLTVEVEDSEENDVIADFTRENSDGKISLTTNTALDAGKYTVTVKDGDTVIGTTTINAVEVGDEGLDSYVLAEDSEDVELDVTVGGEDPATTTKGYDLEGTVDGVTVTWDSVQSTLQELETDGYNVALRSSDDEVAKAQFTNDAEGQSQTDDTLAFTDDATKNVEVEGLKEGTATIELVAKKGDYADVLVSTTVTVANDTVQLTDENVSIANEAEVIDLGEVSKPTADNVEAELVYGADSEAVPADAVANVELTNKAIDGTTVTGDVIVTFDTPFGGEEIVRPVEYVDTDIVVAKENLTNDLTTAASYSDYSDEPYEGNYVDFSNVTVADTAVTADIAGASDITGGTNVAGLADGESASVIDYYAFKLAAADEEQSVGNYSDFKALETSVKESYVTSATEGIVTNTLARYLGALNYANNSSVEEIEYDGTTYAWDSSQDNTGSNWADSEGNTLVAAIGTVNDGDTVTLTLADANGNSQEVTFDVNLPNEA